MGLLEAIAGMIGLRRRKRKRGRVDYVNPLGLKRVIIDGEEYLVRDVLKIDGDEIVVVDPDGTIRTIKRRGKKVRVEGEENTPVSLSMQQGGAAG